MDRSKVEIILKAQTSIKIKQTGSAVARTKVQKDTLRGIGLGKIGMVKELQVTPSIIGMIKKVSHLVEIIEQ